MDEIEVMKLIQDMYDYCKGNKTIDADVSFEPNTKKVDTILIHIRMKSN